MAQKDFSLDLKTFPYTQLIYGFVAFGKIPDGSVKPYILGCKKICAVDGGLNHCHALSINPHIIIGDMDTVDKGVLAQYGSISQRKFERAKDKTDLQAAIDALKISEKIGDADHIAIFAGLGKRLDLTLSNIFLLFHYSPLTYLRSEREMVFLLRASRRITILRDEQTPLRFCCFFPFYGTASKIRVRGENLSSEVSALNKDTLCPVPIVLGKETVLEVEKGDAICILHSEERKFEYGDFFSKDSCCQIFMDIHRMFALGKLGIKNGDEEEIFALSEKNTEFKFSCEEGTTISLFPIFGPVERVVTTGLKWELTGQDLTSEFFSVSNVSIQKDVTVMITKGYLLGIINRRIVDKDMINLVDHSSTANLVTPIVDKEQ